MPRYVYTSYFKYTVLALVLILVLNIACAEDHKPVKRIGILQFTHRLDKAVDDIKTGLSDLGYVDGQHVSYLYKNAELNPDNLAKHIQEMIEENVDLIVAVTTPAAVIARQYTQDTGIPVIFTLVSDPVAAGLLENPSLPGGNITGVMDAGNIIASKRLEILLEVEPDIKRVLVVHSDTQSLLPGITALHHTAKTLGIKLQTIQAPTVEKVRAAYAHIRPGAIDAVFVPSDAIVIQGDDALLDFLKQERIPSIGDHGVENVVINYGAPLPSLSKQTAVLIAKVLKGADPATLPVELPRQHHLTLSVPNAEQVGYQIREESYILADEILN